MSASFAALAACGGTEMDLRVHRTTVEVKGAGEIPFELDAFRRALGRFSGPMLDVQFDPDAPYAAWVALQRALVDLREIKRIRVRLSGERRGIVLDCGAFVPRRAETRTIPPLVVHEPLLHLCAGRDDASMQDHIVSFLDHQERIEPGATGCAVQVELAFEGARRFGPGSEGVLREHVGRIAAGIAAYDPKIPLVLNPDRGLAFGYFWAAFLACRSAGVRFEEAARLHR